MKSNQPEWCFLSKKIVAKLKKNKFESIYEGMPTMYLDQNFLLTHYLSYLFICLSSTYQSCIIYPSIHPSILPSIHLSLSPCLGIYSYHIYLPSLSLASIYLSTYLSSIYIYLSLIYPNTYILTHPYKLRVWSVLNLQIVLGWVLNQK